MPCWFSPDTEFSRGRFGGQNTLLQLSEPADPRQRRSSCVLNKELEGAFMSFESRLRYFNLYKDVILKTLQYDKDTGEMSDQIKVRLAQAYLDLMSED